MEPNILVIAGPTACGKSALALELAERLGAEIIGADAFQLYRGMEILTAAPDASARARVPHHLVGCADPAETWTAARFQRAAEESIRGVRARGRRAVVVGGTGLYVHSLTHAITHAPPPDPGLRAELSALRPEDLRRRLDRADPHAAAQIETRNPRRVQRALEIVLTTGLPLATARRPPGPRAGIRGVLVLRGREESRQRIEARIEGMFDAGVEAEVAALGQLGHTADKAIGLREIRSLLRGEISRDECARQITVITMRYAKRQETWFRHQERFPTFNLDETRPPWEPILALWSP